MDRRTKSVLHELEKTRYRYWNICPEIGALLNIVAKAMKAERVLEIGTSNGYSTIWLADAVRGRNGKVVTVDIDSGILKLAKANLGRAGLASYVELVHGDALDVIPQLEGGFDLVFIDADKSEYYQYLKLSFDKVKDSGLIVAEDVTVYRDSMRDFLSEITSSERLETVIIPYDDGISLSYKLASSILTES
jgi:predicted O-methyltransferase YrrM